MSRSNDDVDVIVVGGGNAAIRPHTRPPAGDAVFCCWSGGSRKAQA
jgi:hypothetical protein